MKTLLITLFAASAFSLTVAAQSLEDIASQRSAEAQQRDAYRHPVETLTFFQLKPGMTVAEALPGGGWYSKVIAPYIGAEGKIYGINYNDDMWARFGFFSEEAIEQQIALTDKFPSMIAEMGSDMPEAEGFTFETVPEAAHKTVDRLLFIRALHNLSRFESEAGTMSNALEAAHKLLKDDGLIGVVQHRAPEGSDDKWADGSAGYLKQSHVIKLFEDAGFKLVATSPINANPKDVPTEGDMVWRLPPTYFGTAEDPALKTKVDAIGESDRMTLLFSK